MTKIFTASGCLGHDCAGFPESPQRLVGVLDELRRRGAALSEAEAHPRRTDLVERVHDPGYVRRFQRATQRGDGLLDSPDTPLVGDTWEAAWGAVDAVLAAVDAVGDHPVFAAVRPPGHHAEHAMAMGFCFFNNVAVAAEAMLDREECARVAIYDLDVHHGNGTQHLFEERSDVFFASSHQYPFYPGTGSAAESGRGEGRGTTLNVPLPSGVGDETVYSVWEETIAPALRDFRPDALLVSAGFDAWSGDPIGGQRWSEESYAFLGEELRALARDLCQGRLLTVLEGGYDLSALPRLVCTYLGVEGES